MLFRSGAETADGFQVSVVLRLTHVGSVTSACVGAFTFDACTMAIDAESRTGGDWGDRIGAINTVWADNGFNTDRSATNWSPLYATNLEIYRASSPAYEDPGNAAHAVSVAVLDVLSEGVMVVSGQWYDYVSQGPFFVNWQDRAYFVEVAAIQDLSADITLFGSSNEGTGITNGDTDPAALVANADYTEEIGRAHV